MKAFFLFFWITCSSLNGQFIELKNTTGTIIEARVLSFQNGKVKLQRNDGLIFVASISIFDSESIEVIKQKVAEISESKKSLTVSSGPRAEKSKVSFSKMNEAVGQKLFVDANLWDDTADEVGGRLNWPVESATSNSISCRLYAPSNYRFLGSRPYSAVFYGSTDNISSFSLVFANKGDCFAAGGVAEEHFKDGTVTNDPAELEKMIERDAEFITQKLNHILGPGKRQNFGQGSAKRKVTRWDWNDHSFLVSVAEGEFVSLSIDKIEVADKRGRQSKVADMHLRRVHEANVEKRDNGDVVILNIPMVDQGPKGYCVPATFERCMRYMEIPADMYLLAMAGNTGMGGGTVISTLVNAVQQEVWVAGRTLNTLNGLPTFKELEKYLKEGVPILWGMHSTQWFNDTANRRTSMRKASQPDMWRKIIEKADEKLEDVSSPQRGENLHICIIHGFNKTTQEIAFTDSWGPRFTERWISAKEAEHFSSGRCWVIEY
tara:strand:- start:1397 stop:2866 length:1470 start_codon:yes stop_codon:yes gene_type:complete